MRNSHTRSIGAGIVACWSMITLLPPGTSKAYRTVGTRDGRVMRGVPGRIRLHTVRGDEGKLRLSAPKCDRRLAGRRDRLASQPSGGVEHRLLDLEVAAATAQVAGQEVP